MLPQKVVGSAAPPNPDAPADSAPPPECPPFAVPPVLVAPPLKAVPPALVAPPLKEVPPLFEPSVEGVPPVLIAPPLKEAPPLFEPSEELAPPEEGREVATVDAPPVMVTDQLPPSPLPPWDKASLSGFVPTVLVAATGFPPLASVCPVAMGDESPPRPTPPDPEPPGPMPPVGGLLLAELGPLPIFPPVVARVVELNQPPRFWLLVALTPPPVPCSIS